MTHKILNLIAQTIFDKKGLNIFVLDVRDESTLTDYFIIAEGTASRHTKALADAIIEAMDKQGYDVCHVEGLAHGDWVVVDFVDVVVHLFAPGVRVQYGLEKLWSEGKIVDVQIQVERNLK